jgi:hypothetical protein
MKETHEKTWAIIRDAIEDYTFSGSATSVGFVEGVLLLAENLPREVSKKTSELLSGGEDAVGLHGTENRRSWALTGLAIRAAYGLGLDQIAIEINEAERTADLERARSTWTWCYLYDRTIGLRTGLAFWSRGPSLCFVGYSHISQTGERAAVANFPYMLNHGPSSPQANEDTDSASLMQALVELTQIMTNAHDILYPSKSRTDILVRQGEYFKVGLRTVSRILDADDLVSRFVPSSTAILQISMAVEEVELRILGATVLVHVPLCPALRIQFRVPGARTACPDESRDRGKHRGEGRRTRQECSALPTRYHIFTCSRPS